MSTDPKKNKDELTNEQADKIAGGRCPPPRGDIDGALDPIRVKEISGEPAQELGTGTRDADTE